MSVLVFDRQSGEVYTGIYTCTYTYMHTSLDRHEHTPTNTEIIFSIFVYFFHNLFCVSVCVRFGVHVKVKRQSKEAVISSYHVGYGHPAQCVRNDNRHI